MTLLGIPLLLALASAGAEQPSIKVRPSTANVSVGERFQITVEASGPVGTTYEFPKQISDGSVELIQSDPTSTLANQVTYDAQIFALGASATIPEIEIRYQTEDGAKGSVKSAQFPLNVVSTLDPNDKNPSPADFSPPVPVLVARAFWIAGSLAGLLLIAGIVLLVRRLRFPKKAIDPKVTPAITPEEEALTSLDGLGKSRGAFEAREFYIELVQILKRYLERRLEAPILEMTSTEALAFIKAHTWTLPHASGLRDLVASADLVKFGGSSDATNGERHVQLVRDLVGRIDRLRRAELERQAQTQDRRTA